MSPRACSIRAAVVIGGLVFLLGYGVDRLALLNPEWILIDAFGLWVVVGLIVFFYEERRRRLLDERLRIIREMNSYIRNELQVIVASASAGGASSTTIGRCVDHIEWALRELLPGKASVEQAAPSHRQPTINRSA